MLILYESKIFNKRKEITIFNSFTEIYRRVSITHTESLQCEGKSIPKVKKYIEKFRKKIMIVIKLL